MLKDFWNRNEGNHTKPLIGVTGPDAGGETAWLFTRIALWRAGGRAVRITPQRPCPNEILDGLIIGGGADIADQQDTVTSKATTAGEIAKEQKSEKTTGFKPVLIFYRALRFVRELLSWKGHRKIDRARDRFELRLLKDAQRRSLPVLGICRGAQMINTFHGGNLHQEIRGLYGEGAYTRSVRPHQWIDIVDHSLLREIVGKQRLKINGLNHQAVNKNGWEIEISAYDQAGIVQSIEHQAANFILGVQWHPEYLPHIEDHQNIFRALVEAAQNRKDAIPARQQPHQQREAVLS